MFHSQGDGIHIRKGRVFDVAAGGCFVEGAMLVKVGDRLPLRLCLPELPLIRPEQGHLKAGCYGNSPCLSFKINETATRGTSYPRPPPRPSAQGYPPRPPSYVNALGCARVASWRQDVLSCPFMSLVLGCFCGYPSVSSSSDTSSKLRVAGSIPAGRTNKSISYEF